MIIGIDTSNYTTSIAVIDSVSGDVIFELSQLLRVKSGGKGLRQSEAFFQHTHALADIFETLIQRININKIRAIAVSSKPRNVDASYMPVFDAGVLFARQLAGTLNISLYKFSHQEGHLMAAWRSINVDNIPSEFYGLHLSGGTTELLDCTYLNGIIQSDTIGATLDLNFGQLIDRIGLELGFNFPCGSEMEALAIQEETDVFERVRVNQSLTFNLSGMENKFKTKLKSEPKSTHQTTIRILFNTIAEILIHLLEPLNAEIPVILSGGVASNSIIKDYLCRKLDKRLIYYSTPAYAKDNAFGIAHLGWEKYKNA